MSFHLYVFAEQFLRVFKHFVTRNARDYTSVDICRNLGRNDVFGVASVMHGLRKRRGYERIGERYLLKHEFEQRAQNVSVYEDKSKREFHVRRDEFETTE